MNTSDPFELTLPLNATDHILGAAHATVSVVEYGDFECPNCKQAAPAVKMLLEHFKGRVSVAFRNFPLEEVHPHAVGAAEAAECAGAQDRFWPMHDLLFDNQPHLKPPQLRSYADKLQIDMARYDLEMDDHVYLQRVREHMQSGRASGVRATPTFFVDGKLTDVSFGMRSLFDTVDAALRKRGMP
jgi:protein-disulfide isomerase